MNDPLHAAAELIRSRMPGPFALPMQPAKVTRGAPPPGFNREQPRAKPQRLQILPECEYIGPGLGCSTRVCEMKHGTPPGVVRRCEHCEGCPDYWANPSFIPPPSRFVPQADDFPVGVVIGSFRWPSLVALQIAVIRNTCGPVPILVSNDDPPTHKRLKTICERFEDVELDTNPERIGHTGGDVAAFHKGIKFGARRNLRYVAKLSQRFIVNRPRWLQDSANELYASGLGMSCRRCRGIETFDLRTEAVLMDIEKWNTPHILQRTIPREYWTDSPRGLAAETVINRINHDLVCNVFWPWGTLMGEERFRRDFADILWHTNTPVEEYRDLASRFGIALDKGFHVDGWHHERARGLYKYG